MAKYGVMSVRTYLTAWMRPITWRRPQSVPSPRVAALLVVLALTCSGSEAEAADPPTGVSARAQPSASTSSATPDAGWYGWQILLADLTSIGLVAASTQMGDARAASGIGAIGGLGYFLGGPIIHGLHHQSPGKVGGSFGLRFGVPAGLGIVGALIGATTPIKGDSIFSDRSFVTFADAAIGVGVGVLVASAIDVIFLAHASSSGSTPSRPKFALRMGDMRGGPSMLTLSGSW